MNLAPDLNKIISASMLRLRMNSPFFATLALFARVVSTERILTAATNGEDIFINPDFVKSLRSSQVDSLLLHEVLHAALLHIPRRGARERMQWNIAADIVVNGMIAQCRGLELPTGALRNPKIEQLNVEEIYELLLKQNQRYPNCEADLLYEPFSDSASDDSSGVLEQVKQAALGTYWRNAMQQAIAVAQSSNSQGSIPIGMQRELGASTQTQLNWRSHLWRYLVQTPTDFIGFDRRYISQRIYLESLQGETVQVFLAVDTSGSVSDYELQLFLSEVRGIISAYPHLECQLYYAAADISEPYNLKVNSQLPKPVGGGGTSFIPFFQTVSEQADQYSSGVCIYLTDGYGIFPQEPPAFPVLWVVTPGGLDSEKFPFGEAVRLLSY